MDKLKALEAAYAAITEAKRHLGRVDLSLKLSCDDLQEDISDEIRRVRFEVGVEQRISRLETPVRYVAPDEARDSEELWCRPQ